MNKSQEVYDDNGGPNSDLYQNFESAGLALLRETTDPILVGVFIDTLIGRGVSITVDGYALRGPLMRDFRSLNEEADGRLSGREIEEGRNPWTGIPWHLDARALVPASAIRALVDLALLNGTVTTVTLLKAQLGLKFNQNYNAEIKVMMIELDPRVERFFRKSRRRVAA